jgi:hypothetical protein
MHLFGLLRERVRNSSRARVQEKNWLFASKRFDDASIEHCHLSSLSVAL